MRKISELEFQENDVCGIRFNQQHLQKLSDAIEQITALKLVTNSSIHILQKLKTYQCLHILVYKNTLFILTKSLINPVRKSTTCGFASGMTFWFLTVTLMVMWHTLLLLIKRYNLYKILACTTAFFQLSLSCATFFQLPMFILLISSKTLSSQRVLGLPIVLLDMGFHLLIF